MTLLELVIVAHRCRSTHHFIAFDALQILQGQDAADWKNLLLRHHVQLLKGAKAPDTEFKDFKNHVLHVQEGEWGGARDKAMEWYGHAVDALRRKKWPEAAYALGVLTHYYADPIQPFHTGQTEEEGAMHRALEWSIAKSRDTIKAMVDVRGYPVIEAGRDTGFVADMVLEGATYSNQYYKTFIDHYDLDRGVKDPPSGLDDTLLNVLADLVAYATAGIATLFERAFEEAGVKPQKVDLDLPGYLAALDIPIRKLTKRMADAGDRKQVEAMYEELQSTGKVIKTLPDDDKKIRKLHATQVLRKPIAELDAQPLKAFGTKHIPREQTELPARYELKVVPVPVEPHGAPSQPKIAPIAPIAAADLAPAVAEVAEPEAKTETLEDSWAQLEADRLAKEEAERLAAEDAARAAEEKAEIERKVAEANTAWEKRQKRKAEEEAARLAAEEAEAARLAEEEKAAKEAEAKAQREAEEKAEAAAKAEAEAKAESDAKAEAERAAAEAAAEAEANAAPVAETVLAEIEASVPEDEEKPVIKSERRDRLTHESPVVDAPSIGPKTAERLQKVDIITIGDLLSADVEETVKALSVRYITTKTMTDWQDQTRLMVEAPGLRVLDSQILVGAGIRDANQLARSSATKVLKAATSFLDTPSGARVLWGAEAKVGEGEVKEWIGYAKSARN